MAAERVGDGGAPDGGAAEGGAESEADRGAAEDVVTVHQHASTDSSPFSSPDLGWSPACTIQYNTFISIIYISDTVQRTL